MPRCSACRRVLQSGLEVEQLRLEAEQTRGQLQQSEERVEQLTATNELLQVRQRGAGRRVDPGMARALCVRLVCTMPY